MNSIINQEKRSAIPSWSGYQYQGHIAIIVTLIQLIKLKSEPQEVEKFELVLEEIEDFSLYRENKVISIHQVKAEKKDSVSDYKEALYYMAAGLTDSSIGTEPVAYLHTSKELQYKDWDEEVKTAVENFVPDKQKELQCLLNDEDKMNEKITGLKRNFSKNTGKFKRTLGSVWNSICDSMKIEEMEDVTADNLKNAIEEYLNNIKPLDISSFLAKGKIKVFEYEDKQKSFAVRDTDTYIEELIKQYWGEELTKQRKDNLKYYRLIIQEIICSYVSERHVDGKKGIRIPFVSFETALDNELEMTEELRILFNKNIFFQYRKNFCEESCSDCSNCDACDLSTKMEWFASLSNTEIKNAFYMMSPNVREDISSSAAVLVNEDGVSESVFRTLREMEYAETDQAGRILYNKEKSFLLTDIEISRRTKNKQYEHLRQNNTIERICDEILKNREFAFERMEIDSLIIYNGQAEEEIDDIAMLKSDTYDLTGMRDDIDEKAEKKPSYARITQKKRVSMIDSGKFIKEHGGQGNE